MDDLGYNPVTHVRIYFDTPSFSYDQIRGRLAYSNSFVHILRCAELVLLGGILLGMHGFRCD